MEYKGGCHCGKVRYKAEADLSQGALSCNCSHCAIKGLLLVFIPAAQFTLLSGEDALTDYQFNKHVIHHLFCRYCGVESFARGTGPDGSEMIALNVRALDDIDLPKLKTIPYDGKSV